MQNQLTFSPFSKAAPETIEAILLQRLFNKVRRLDTMHLFPRSQDVFLSGSGILRLTPEYSAAVWRKI
jgi:hypothetical protein